MTGVVERPSYNPIFTRFVELEKEGDEQLQGLVAYGLYKISKREWVKQHFERHGRKPTYDELAGYAATWTESRLSGLEEQAEGALGQFASVIVDANAPAIREEALKGTTPKAIWTSMVASFLYTLVLIGIVLALRYNGVDLLSVAGSVGGGAGK